MIINNLDSLANIEYFLAKLTKLSRETGIQVGDDSRSNILITHDKLNGRYTLENSVAFGFVHAREGRYAQKKLKEN